MNVDPTDVLSYMTEQRLQCLECKKVRYKVDGPVEVFSVGIEAIPDPDAMAVDKEAKEKTDKISYKPVSLVTTIASQLRSGEVLDGYSCGECKRNTQALRYIILSRLLFEGHLIDVKAAEVCFVPGRFGDPCQEIPTR